MRDCFYTVVDQLDLAARKLETREPLHARLALILTDNVVELMLHQQCVEAAQQDRLYGNLRHLHHLPHLRDVRLEPRLRSEILGRYFAPKLSFCKQKRQLSEDDAELIRVGHDIRNEPSGEPGDSPREIEQKAAAAPYYGFWSANTDQGARQFLEIYWSDKGSITHVIFLDALPKDPKVNYEDYEKFPDNGEPYFNAVDGKLECGFTPKKMTVALNGPDTLVVNWDGQMSNVAYSRVR